MAGMLLPLAIRYQSRGGSLDFDKFDKDGLNALMYAVVGGYIQIVRLLLIAGCDPRIMYVPKKAMMLPRSIVQLANDNNHPDIAEMLIEAIQEKEISEREKQGRQKKTNRSMLFYNKPSDFGQTVQPKKSRRSRNK